MPFPLTGDIQLVPAGPAQLFVDSVRDPGGPPANVLDVDLGFEVKGRVTLYHSFTGRGLVGIYVDELACPIGHRLLPCVDITITADPAEPKLKTYNWTITF